MAKIGYFEVADSSCRFRGIGHFLGESAISKYIMYTKIRGIGHFLGESARDPLSMRKRSENVKITTFGRLSGMYIEKRS